MIHILQTDMIMNIESVMEVNKITSEQEKIFSRLVSSFGKEKKIKQKKYKKKNENTFIFHPLRPNISMHTLHTVLYIFAKK